MAKNAEVHFLAGLCLSLLIVALHATEYPLPKEVGPANSYGRNLQRSMRLMASSNPQKKRTVKILVFGQSISQEVWTVWLTDYLRSKYPNANLVVTNLALGYTSEILVRPAAADIPNFYPDLMIFQDYGALNFYEEMIGYARRQTTTDLLIQTDHVNLPEDLDEPTDPSFPGGLPERAARNYVSLPAIAQRYGGELAYVRTYWKQYLRDYDIQPADLLRDPIHPNWWGNVVMEELLKPYFRVDESFDSSSWDKAEITYTIGQDTVWNGDELNLEFEGNRVDVIAEENSTDPIDVRIDGKRPSEFPELYHLTRVDTYPGANWLAILKVAALKPLLDEDWTAKITEFTTNNGVPFARFAVYGSKTAFDGEGSITERFVSNSGRAVIETADWLMLYWTAAYYPDLKPLPAGHEIHWRSALFGKDQFTPVANDPALESTITLAQGLSRGRHMLTLRRHGAAPISGIRIFNPAARIHPPLAAPEIAHFEWAEENCTLFVNATGRYVVESSGDGVSWTPVSAPIAEARFSVPAAEHLAFFRLRAID